MVVMPRCNNLSSRADEISNQNEVGKTPPVENEDDATHDDEDDDETVPGDAVKQIYKTESVVRPPLQ